MCLYLYFISIILTLSYPTSTVNKTFELQDAIVIKNGTIITADDKENITSFIGTVVIQNDTIICVSKKQLKLKGSFTEIDAMNKYLIPGLIDSHVHIGHTIGVSEGDWESRKDLINEYYKQLPKSYLLFGFTSLIDLDLKSTTENQFNSNPIKPRLYSAARGIRIFNGYGQSLFPKPIRYKIFPNWICNLEQKDDIPTEFNLNDFKIEYQLINAIKREPICIKTYHESGFGKFDWPVPSDSLMKHLVKETHKYNLPLVLHANSIEGYKSGLRNDVDVFAHGLWRWDGSPLDANPPNEVKDILHEIANRDKYVQMTMRVIIGEYDDYKWDMILDTNLRKVLPYNLIDHMKTEEGQFYRKKLIERYDINKPDKELNNEVYLEYALQKIRNVAGMAKKMDVKIILGSDTPSSEGIGNPIGYNGFLEIKALKSAGFTEKDIFLAATIRNAIAFNLEKEIGAIREGLRADVLIINQNPLNSIKAYNSISKLIVKGKILNPSDLKAKK